MPFIALLADAPTPDSHRWRIHADLQPLQLQINPTPMYESTQLHLAIPGSSASLGLGFAPHRMLLVGTRLSASFARNASRAWDYWRNEGSVGLFPYLEVRPLPHLRVQPFVLAEGGVNYGLHRDSGPYPTGVLTHVISPRVNGRVGMHAFVLPRVSIDADVGFGHSWMFVAGAGQSHLSTTQWLVTGTIGVSGWF